MEKPWRLWEPKREQGGLPGGGEGELGTGRTEEVRRAFQAEGAAWARARGQLGVAGDAERASFGWSTELG